VGRFALLYSERVARLVASKAKEQSAWYSWHDSLGWHHVKVEIEVLCTDTTEDCEGNVTGFSFPYLKHTKCGALDDCWTIVPKLRGANGGGAAKIKVIRSDENRSPLSFISGKPLWQIRYSHPQKPGEPSVSTLGNCFPGDWAPGAINSSDPAFSLGAAGFNCDGSDVDTSLQYGIMSISCVEWSFQAGGVKFIPCTFYDLMKSNVNTYCKYDAN
ncbi:MAG: hypothetical protein Q8N14_03445, partial [Candidatus Omnitrophota bacterium]|nr:hypothetical protein [Candidatus Omnitrophota bacterium]